jgi:outer membrane protein TolC
MNAAACISCAPRRAGRREGENRSPRRRGPGGAAVLLVALAAFPAAGADEPGAPTPAAPQAAPVHLGLDEAIRTGLAQNPDLAALRADAEASGAGRHAAETGYQPRLYTEAGWRRSNNQVIVFSDKLTAGEFTASDFDLDALNHPDALNHGLVAVGVEVPIDVSRRVGAGVDAARGAEEAAGAQRLAAEIDLVVRITEAYHAIGLSDAAVEVAVEALENARRSESIALARADRGAALKSDALRARAARLDRERDLDRRRADAALARSRLAVLMGSGSGLVIGGTDRDLGAPGDLGPLEDWTRGAADARPDIDAARRGAQAAGAAAASARATRGPEMGALARYELNANSFDAGEGSYLLGLSVRWNAWDGGRSPRIEEADARARAARARPRSAEDAVGLEVETAWRDAQVADRGMSAAHEAAVAAEEARRISADRYAGGLLPLNDLLQAESGALAARLGEIAARYDAVVARVRLEQKSGKLEVPR